MPEIKLYLKTVGGSGGGGLLTTEYRFVLGQWFSQNHLIMGPTAYQTQEGAGTGGKTLHFYLSSRGTI